MGTEHYMGEAQKECFRTLLVAMEKSLEARSRVAAAEIAVHNPHYDPGTLLDTLTGLLGARNDRHFADKLSGQPSQICKIRKRRVSVAPALLISMHEETGLSIRQLRALMGDFREHSGPSAKHPSVPQLHHFGGLRPMTGWPLLSPNEEPAGV